MSLSSGIADIDAVSLLVYKVYLVAHLFPNPATAVCIEYLAVAILCAFEPEALVVF